MAFVKPVAIGLVGKSDAAVLVWDDVVRRVERLPLEILCPSIAVGNTDNYSPPTGALAVPPVAGVAARQIDDNQGTRFGDHVFCCTPHTPSRGASMTPPISPCPSAALQAVMGMTPSAAPLSASRQHCATWLAAGGNRIQTLGPSRRQKCRKGRTTPSRQVDSPGGGTKGPNPIPPPVSLLCGPGHR